MTKQNPLNDPEPDFSNWDAYLGDGVYVSFDGYQLWLAANNHENKVIALEPQVFENLINYAKRMGYVT